MRSIDPAKVFIIAMSVVILGLGIAIVLTYSQVQAYEDAYAEAKDLHYKKLVDEVESCKIYRDQEEEGDRIKIDNPITYILDKASQARIDRGAIEFGQPKTKNSQQKGYTETRHGITVKTDVDRKQLTEFLFNLEAGSTLLKVVDLKLQRERRRRGQQTGEDMWRPVIELGFRKAYSRGT